MIVNEGVGIVSQREDERRVSHSVNDDDWGDAAPTLFE